MSKTFKRISALVLAGAMALSLAACGGGRTAAETIKSDRPIDITESTGEPIELSIAMGSHSSWPYKEDWPIWDWIEEATNTKLTIQAIPTTDMNTKLSLMLASPETLPDLIHLMSGAATASTHGISGAFVPISDNLDRMPNYKAFIASLPEEEARELEAQRTAGDGKMYMPPVYGTQTIMNLRTWLYRKDIFEKHNLAIPTNEDELYNVCLELKKLYPESYPLCFRTGMSQIEVMGPMWKNNFSYRTYYDFENEKWCYGATDSETMLHIIEYYQKMLNDGLVPPDFLTIATKSWEELVSTDRGFIMPEYLVRIDHFNKICRKDNPSFTLAVMTPPAGSTPGGQSKIAKLNIDPTGYVVCNTGKEDQMATALSFVDWMYSDEATDLLSWGKEGVSYTTDANGDRNFILPNEGDSVAALYGIGSYGVYQRTTSYEESYSDEQREQGKLAYASTETNANPNLWLAFSDEESDSLAAIETPIREYVEEMVCKFILGQEPMSNWDSFQAELSNMGVQDVLDIYTTAYNRVIGK